MDNNERNVKVKVSNLYSRPVMQEECWIGCKRIKNQASVTLLSFFLEW